MAQKVGRGEIYNPPVTCISTEMADDVMNSCWCAAVNFRVRALAEIILTEQTQPKYIKNY